MMWVGRKIIGKQSTNSRWLRRLILVFTVLRWIDRRFQPQTAAISLKRGESLLINVQQNGDSPR